MFNARTIIIKLSAIAAAAISINGFAWAAPEMGKVNAMARIQAGVASSKAPAALISRLLNKKNSEFIVEYMPDEQLPSSASSKSENAATTESLRRHGIESTKIAVDQAVPGITVLKEYKALPMQFVRTGSREALVKLLENRQVKAIHENLRGEFQLAESLGDIGYYEAMVYGSQYKGEGTTVVVMDSGINYTRPAFGNCTAPGVPSTCRVSELVEIAEEDGQLDMQKHGSRVAGIIAAVAPKANIVGLDVGSLDGSVHLDDMIEGINWVLLNKSRYNIVALNISIGIRGQTFSSECTEFTAFTEAFRLLRESNILPVVATGNNGLPGHTLMPACVPGAVRVGATYDSTPSISDNKCPAGVTPQPWEVACFSNGGLVTLLAPGSAIAAGGEPASGGTSLAAPHIAGAIAVLRGSPAGSSESPTMTTFRLRTYGAPTTDHRNGKVIPSLDLGEAVQSLVQGRPPF